MCSRKQSLGYAASALIATQLILGAAWASNSVVVGSRTALPDETGVQVGVFVTNDIPITGIVIPLELRSVTPGSYVTTAFNFQQNTAGRIYNSPLGPGNSPPGNVFIRRYATPDTLLCGGPISNTYQGGVGQIDFVSPDGSLYAATSTGEPSSGDDMTLDPGVDPPGKPSLLFTFNVTAVVGTFEIDTCCVRPANHLGFVDELTNLMVPSFTKGVITISLEGFYGTPKVGDPPLTVFFTEVNYTGTPMDSWAWDFGDGGVSTLQNPIHIYTDPGDYTVTLVATRGIETFIVSALGYIHVNSLRADFSAAPLWGVAPLDVTFTDLSQGGPTSWSWDFGDGGTSSQQNPMHSYGAAGFFDVTLTVFNASATDAKQVLHYVHVSQFAEPDLHVNTYGNTRPRPGFDKTYIMRIQNAGTTPSDPTDLHFDIPLPATYVSSVPSGTEVSGTVSWSVPAIDPGTAGESYRVTVNVPVGTPEFTILSASTNVDAVPGELVVSNNMDVDDEIVITSVDPNDLVVQPDGCGSGKDLIQGTPPLTYTIFFENKPTASAEAIYVLVVDTLDPDLDWGTLQIGPSSRDDVLTVDFDPLSGEIRWFFDGIDLPPNVNPPEGEGFVSYTIAPKAGLANSSVIAARAHIRFDFENWLSAPESGPRNLMINPCPPPCDCPCKYDPQCDGIISNVLDVTRVIDVAFRSLPAVVDPDCPRERSDVDASGVTNVLDVTKTINVAFRGQTIAANFVDPCL